MLLAQAASIQVVSIIHRIKVRKIEIANFNTSVEYPSRPAGAAPVYVRVSFQGGRLVAPLPLTRFFLRTSENSRYAKFARISGSFPKPPGKGPSEESTLATLVGPYQRRGPHTEHAKVLLSPKVAPSASATV